MNTASPSLKRPLISPFDRSSASRIFTSISGPMMTPRISGRTGIPNRRIAKPTAPNTSSSAMSKGSWFTAYAPSEAKKRMPA